MDVKVLTGGLSIRGGGGGVGRWLLGAEEGGGGER